MFLSCRDRDDSLGFELVASLEGSWRSEYIAQEREFVLLIILSTMPSHFKYLLHQYFPDTFITSIVFSFKSDKKALSQELQCPFVTSFAAYHIDPYNLGTLSQSISWSTSSSF